MCDFSLVTETNKKNKTKSIGDIKNCNMAPFIGHTGDDEVKMTFNGAKYPNTYIVIRWNI